MARQAPRNPFALTPSKPVLRALEGAPRRRVLPAKAGIQRGAGQGTPNPHRALDSPTLGRRGASRSARPAAAGLSPLHHQQPPPHPILPASRGIPPPLPRRITLTRPYCPHPTPPLPSPHGTRHATLSPQPEQHRVHHAVGAAMALIVGGMDRIDGQSGAPPQYQPEVVSHGRKSWDQYFISRTKAPATTTPTKQPPAAARPAFRWRRQSQAPAAQVPPSSPPAVRLPSACATRAGVRNSAQPKPRR